LAQSKQEIIAALREVFEGWEASLRSISDEQVNAPNFSGNLSVKDVVAHLWAWQQLSIARVEAALQNREPEFSMWPADLDSDSDEDLDKINAWIYETYRGQPWSSVYQAWREGFQRFLQLAEAVPEEDLIEPGRYQWLGDYPLYDVLEGSWEHHREHLVA
jgi:hypothetical protein